MSIFGETHRKHHRILNAACGVAVYLPLQAAQELLCMLAGVACAALATVAQSQAGRDVIVPRETSGSRPCLRTGLSAALLMSVVVLLLSATDSG